MDGQVASGQRGGTGQLQRDASKPGAKDATAQKIIDAAKDRAKTPDDGTRGKSCERR